jgi:hypothetical protein
MESTNDNSAAAALRSEATVFCRYLAGREASDYVAGHYVRAHAQAARFAPRTPFDAALLRLGAGGPWTAHLCDSYACLLARDCALRRKLVLLLAILESCGPEHGFNDQVAESSAAMVVGRMAVRGTLFAVRLLLAGVVLVPLQVLCSVFGRNERGAT